MSSFYRYPHMTHLAWLSKAPARDDKVLSSAEVGALLTGDVSVEEKLDGANLGISVEDGRQLNFQNRGQYLSRPFSGQFARLHSWLEQHVDHLLHFLKPNLIVFGEWLAARHSIFYRSLSDLFVAFDVYDRESRKFWCATRRDTLAETLGLKVVPCLFRGRTNMDVLVKLATDGVSQFGAGDLEGLVIRRDGELFNESRAKLVRPGFVQETGDHWRRRKLEWNQVGST